MLDVISGGRLIAGFPVGTSMDINYCYGQNPATLRDKYREAHDLIIKAWAEREPFAWNGKYTKLRYVNLWPQPIQKPHPPIWVPGPRLDRDLGLLRRPRLQLQLPLVQRLQARPEDDGRLLGARARSAAPRRTRTARRSSSRCASATPTPRASASGGRTSTTSSTSACTSIPAWSEAPGYRSEASLRAGVVAQVGNTSRQHGHEQDAGRSWSSSATSSPARRRRCASSSRSWRARCASDISLLGLHIGSAPIELDESLAPISARTQVLPQLRPLFDRVRRSLVAEGVAGGGARAARARRRARRRAARRARAARGAA